MLAGAAEIEWSALKRAATPKLLTSGEAPDFNLEGVTVWRESQEPWRPVRRLIVLGFAQDRYPAALGRNAVFSAEDLAAIVAMHRVAGRDAGRGAGVKARAVPAAARCGRGGGDVAGAAAGCDGEVAVTPSESLVFMHQLFAGPESANELVVELDAAEGRAKARGVAFAAVAEPVAPRELVIADLEFGRDLLELRVDAAGQGETGVAQQSRDPDGVGARVVAQAARGGADCLGA